MQKYMVMIMTAGRIGNSGKDNIEEWRDNDDDCELDVKLTTERRPTHNEELFIIYWL